MNEEINEILYYHPHLLNKYRLEHKFLKFEEYPAYKADILKKVKKYGENLIHHKKEIAIKPETINNIFHDMMVNRLKISGKIEKINPREYKKKYNKEEYKKNFKKGEERIVNVKKHLNFKEYRFFFKGLNIDEAGEKIRDIINKVFAYYYPNQDMNKMTGYLRLFRKNGYIFSTVRGLNNLESLLENYRMKRQKIITSEVLKGCVCGAKGNKDCTCANPYEDDYKIYSV